MRVQIPAKAKFAPTCVRNSLLSYYLFIIPKLFKVQDGYLKYVWFTAFLDSKIHTRLAIVTGNEIRLAFPPRNLPKKISSRSVHVLFSYRGNRQTDKQTDRQTYVGDYIILAKAFAGITRKLPGERDNARNNARCTQARKTMHGLDGQHQHQDVDRTPRGRVSQNDRGQR